MGGIILAYVRLIDRSRGERWEDLHKTRTLLVFVQRSALDTMRFSILLPVSPALISVALAAPLLEVYLLFLHTSIWTAISVGKR
jgi:hypothetical protein